MSFQLTRYLRPHVGTGLLVGAVVAALALLAPAEHGGSCPAPEGAPRATSSATSPTAERTVPHVRTASGGEVARGRACSESAFPPLALLAAAAAMLAVPRARQGAMMEL